MKKLTISFLMISLFNYLACTTLNVASKESIKGEMKNDTLSGEIYVFTMDHNRYHFGNWGGDWGYHIENDSLYGKGLKINPNGVKPFEGKIAMDNISYFEIEEVDALKTTEGILVVPLGITIIAYYVDALIEMSSWK
jgi:hypothetical protein